MTRRLLFAAVLAAVLSAGCLDFLKSDTTPTTFSASTLSGSWASVSAGTGLPAACSDFHWVVTSVTGTTGTGTFTAACAGGITLAGTASGTVSGSTVTWTATATASAAGFPQCPIALSGTATIESDSQIRVPYTGTTCLGAVSGTELLRKG